MKELRTPEFLLEAVETAPELARELSRGRPLLEAARRGEASGLGAALAEEERAERERDRLYWQPLKAELEQLLHAARRR